MSKKKLLKIASVTVALFVSIFSFALAANVTVHRLGYSSVDTGEIRWGSSTQYTSYRDYAINLWNSLGKVKIAPDTIWTYEDLTFKDQYVPGESWTGMYVYRWLGTDEIIFNTYYFNQSWRIPYYNRKTAAHKLGHALGIGDHYEDFAGYQYLIMNGYQSSVTTLHSHDKSDYYSIYK